MSKWKDFIKRNKVLYPCAKFVKQIIFNQSVKPLNKAKLDQKIRGMMGQGIEQHAGGESVMISLTSFPARIEDVKYTIYSLFQQTYKPDKIVLWLGEEQFPHKKNDLPEDLLKMTDKGLTISFVKDIKSFKKLIPALQSDIRYLIITVDDDIYYPPKFVEKLMREHREHSDCIVAYRAHRIIFADGRVAPYSAWEKGVHDKIAKPSFLNFFTGVGGVLYDAKLLYKDILREDLFMKLCPKADDVWFNAMTALQGTKTKIVKGGPFPLRYVNPEKEIAGDNTLSSYNINHGGNDRQIKAVLEYYPELMIILKNELSEKSGGVAKPLNKKYYPQLSSYETLVVQAA